MIGGHNTTTHYQYSLVDKFRKAPDYFSSSYAMEFMDSSHLGILSQVFNIKGEGYTIGGAMAGSNLALIQAQRLIQQGYIDICLVVGIMADLSPMEIQAFFNAGAMGGHSYAKQPEKASRPFDSQHEGFIYGQACGAIILESASSLRKRKIKPIAKLSSGAMVLGANYAPDPSVEDEIRVMRQALQYGKLKIDEIDYINAHGTSTPLGESNRTYGYFRLISEPMFSHVDQLNQEHYWTLSLVSWNH